MPGINEKIFIKTGVIYSQARNLEGEMHSYISFPVHICYMAPATYRLRPTVSVSLISPTYSAGLQYRINKHLNAGIQGWADFYSDTRMFLFPDELFYYSILGSLYLNL
jgi:hypothetical protein